MNCSDQNASLSCFAGEVERAHVRLHEGLELRLGESARVAQDRAAQAAAVVAVLVDEPGRVHRPPRVADEDEGLAGRNGLFDDQAQVLEIAGKGVAGGVEALRQPGAALIPELHAVAVVGQRAQRQQVPVVNAGAAVQHDHGRGGGGTERLGVQQRARDLDARQGRDPRRPSWEPGSQGRPGSRQPVMVIGRSSGASASGNRRSE